MKAQWGLSIIDIRVKISKYEILNLIFNILINQTNHKYVNLC